MTTEQRDPVLEGKEFIDLVFAIVEKKFGPDCEINNEFADEVIRLCQIGRNSMDDLRTELKSLQTKSND